MDNRQHIFDFDENKICIVINVTDLHKYDITLKSLQKLNVPQGKEIELCEIFDAETIGTAYNQAIKQSNAKYKVYIREGVEIVNKDMLLEIIDLFEYEYKAGIIGMSGSEYIPVDTDIYKTNKYYGAVYDYVVKKNIIGKSFDTGAKVVDALDGLFLATQYDIPWQENEFSTLYYLTLSQCTEFKRHGYSSMVMRQEKPWISYGNFMDNQKCDNSNEREIFKEKYYKDVFPLVSILIQTHNRPEYLKIALESAINQTYKNLDIVISDNSDNNQTYVLIEEYKKNDDRIRYFFHRGASSVKNNAVLCDNIRGEYMSWLMDDDVYNIKKIEKMIDYYREYDNVSLVTSKREIIDKFGNIMDMEIALSVKENVIISGKCVIKNIICNLENFIGEPTTPLLKTELVKDIFKSYYGEHKYANIFGRKVIAMDMGLRQLYGMGDMMLWVDLLRKGDLVYINDKLSSFRVHDQQDQKQRDTMWQVNMMIGFYLLIHLLYKNEYIMQDDIEILEILMTYKNIFDYIVMEKNISSDVLYYKEFYKCYEFLNYELENKCIVNIFDKYDF